MVADSFADPKAVGVAEVIAIVSAPEATVVRWDSVIIGAVSRPLSYRPDYRYHVSCLHRHRA